MNIARVGLLVVAVAAAGGAAFLVRTLTHKQAHAAHQAVQAPESHVLVAARAIEPGMVLKPDDLRWQPWPQDGVAPNFMTEEGAPRAMSDALGTTVRAHVDAGEPITSAKLVHGKDAGYMAALLAPGMRAISIKIDEESAAGGFVLPGDHVDIVMTHRVDRSAEGGSSENYESETVLSDVKVLAIGQTVDDTNGDKVVQGKTATLELSPSEGELLALAGAQGNLTLLLRSATNSDVTGAIGPKAGLGSRGQNDTIRLVRYGHATRVTPGAIASSGDGR
jgi:pilus assembly protein CpaB